MEEEPSGGESIVFVWFVTRAQLLFFLKFKTRSSIAVCGKST